MAFPTVNSAIRWNEQQQHTKLACRYITWELHGYPYAVYLWLLSFIMSIVFSIFLLFFFSLYWKKCLNSIRDMAISCQINWFNCPIKSRQITVNTEQRRKQRKKMKYFYSRLHKWKMICICFISKKSWLK